MFLLSTANDRFFDFHTFRHNGMATDEDVADDLHVFRADQVFHAESCGGGGVCFPDLRFFDRGRDGGFDGFLIVFVVLGFFGFEHGAAHNVVCGVFLGRLKGDVVAEARRLDDHQVRAG